MRCGAGGGLCVDGWVGARTDHFGVVVLGHDLLSDGGEEVEGVLLLHVEQQLGRHDVLLSSEREKRKRREVVLSPARAQIG